MRRTQCTGPTPPGFEAMLEWWRNDVHDFEHVVRAIFDSEYSIYFMCQSYGEQWNQEGAPGYGEDASGPLELFQRTSTMPNNHYYRYNLSNSHYDRNGRQTLGLNDWHTATEADWIDLGYFDGNDSEVYSGWHIPFQPEWMNALAGNAAYDNAQAHQALQERPMTQGDMVTIAPIPAGQRSR